MHRSRRPRRSLVNSNVVDLDTVWQLGGNWAGEWVMHQRKVTGATRCEVRGRIREACSGTLGLDEDEAGGLGGLGSLAGLVKPTLGPPVDQRLFVKDSSGRVVRTLPTLAARAAAIREIRAAEKALLTGARHQYREELFQDTRSRLQALQITMHDDEVVAAEQAGAEARAQAEAEAAVAADKAHKAQARSAVERATKGKHLANAVERDSKGKHLANGHPLAKGNHAPLPAHGVHSAAHKGVPRLHKGAAELRHHDSKLHLSAVAPTALPARSTSRAQMLSSKPRAPTGAAAGAGAEAARPENAPGTETEAESAASREGSGGGPSRPGRLYKPARTMSVDAGSAVAAAADGSGDAAAGPGGRRGSAGGGSAGAKRARPGGGLRRVQLTEHTREYEPDPNYAPSSVHSGASRTTVSRYLDMAVDGAGGVGVYGSLEEHVAATVAARFGVFQNAVLPATSLHDTVAPPPRNSRASCDDGAPFAAAAATAAGPPGAVNSEGGLEGISTGKFKYRTIVRLEQDEVESVPLLLLRPLWVPADWQQQGLEGVYSAAADGSPAALTDAAKQADKLRAKGEHKRTLPPAEWELEDPAWSPPPAAAARSTTPAEDDAIDEQIQQGGKTEPPPIPTHPAYARSVCCKLVEAARSGCMDDIVTLVLSRPVGPLLNEQDCLGWNPLMAAAANGHAGVLRYLLAHRAEPSRHDWRQQTALHYAATGGHATCVRVLLDAGSILGARDVLGRTALHSALWVWERARRVRARADSKRHRALAAGDGSGGAQRAAAGLSAGTAAARQDDDDEGTVEAKVSSIEKVVAELWARALHTPHGHALLHTVDLDSSTPRLLEQEINGSLCTAARAGRLERVQKLVLMQLDEAHSQAASANSSGEARGLERGVGAAPGVAAASAALKQLGGGGGLDLDGAMHELSLTAMHEAAAAGQLQVVDLLIRYGAATTLAVDTRGQTALHSAAAHGRTAVVRLLLCVHARDGDPVEGARRAGAGLADKRGRTALHLALLGGHFATAESLLAQAGPAAGRGLQDEQGLSALHLCAAMGAKDVALLLLHHGWPADQMRVTVRAQHVDAGLRAEVGRAVRSAIARPSERESESQRERGSEKEQGERRGSRASVDLAGSAGGGSRPGSRMSSRPGSRQSGESGGGSRANSPTRASARPRLACRASLRRTPPRASLVPGPWAGGRGDLRRALRRQKLHLLGSPWKKEPAPAWIATPLYVPQGAARQDDPEGGAGVLVKTHRRFSSFGVGAGGGPQQKPGREWVLTAASPLALAIRAAMSLPLGGSASEPVVDRYGDVVRGRGAAGGSRGATEALELVAILLHHGADANACADDNDIDRSAAAGDAGGGAAEGGRPLLALAHHCMRAAVASTAGGRIEPALEWNYVQLLKMMTRDPALVAQARGGQAGPAAAGAAAVAEGGKTVDKPGGVGATSNNAFLSRGRAEASLAAAAAGAAAAAAASALASAAHAEAAAQQAVAGKQAHAADGRLRKATSATRRLQKEVDELAASMEQARGATKDMMVLALKASRDKLTAALEALGQQGVRARALFAAAAAVSAAAPRRRRPRPR
jgi:ankyrin repeat protein